MPVSTAQVFHLFDHLFVFFLCLAFFHDQQSIYRSEFYSVADNEGHLSKAANFLIRNSENEKSVVSENQKAKNSKRSKLSKVWLVKRRRTLKKRKSSVSQKTQNL